MVRLIQNVRLAIWLGDSLKNQRAFPGDVQDVLGHDLDEVQGGSMPDAAKPLPEYGLGVYEIGEDYNTDTYRLIFLLGLKKGVYVLHTFKKKSKSGKAHPKNDKDIIRKRIMSARHEDAS
jgi:phage-related protein